MTTEALEKMIIPKNPEELSASIGKVVSIFLTSDSKIGTPAVYKKNDGKCEHYYRKSKNISTDTFVMQSTRNGIYENAVFVFLSRNRFNEYRNHKDGVFLSYALEAHVIEPSHEKWKDFQEDINKLEKAGVWQPAGVKA